jgi:hypothetical protein
LQHPGYPLDPPLASAEYRGGSDYHWFKVGGPGQELLFSKHRVILGYLDHKAEIDQQLATMFANGQRRLRIGIEFADDDSPNRLHLTNGNLAADDTSRIAALLASIKQTGFEQVYVNINGSGQTHNVRDWKEWNEAAYREGLGVISQTREMLKASGLAYLIDLGGEYTPVLNGQEMRVQYCRRLWTDYVNVFGADDTVGFSIISNISNDRYGHLRDIYGETPPKAFDLHIYARRDEGTGHYLEDSYQRFIHAHKRLAEVGYGDIPWIIGECYYNDGPEADQLAQAIHETRRRILFLLQFPHVRPPFPKPPHYSDVDVVPLNFEQYISRGF